MMDWPVWVSKIYFSSPSTLQKFRNLYNARGAWELKLVTAASPLLDTEGGPVILGGINWFVDFGTFYPFNYFEPLTSDFYWEA